MYKLMANARLSVRHVAICTEANASVYLNIPINVDMK